MCVCFSYDVIRYFVIPVIGYVFGYVIPVMRACAGDCVRLRDLCHPRYPRLLCDPRYVLVYVICDPLFLFSVICPRSRFRLSYAEGLCSSGMSERQKNDVTAPIGGGRGGGSWRDARNIGSIGAEHRRGARGGLAGLRGAWGRAVADVGRDVSEAVRAGGRRPNSF